MLIVMVVNDIDLMIDVVKKGLGIGRIVEFMVDELFEIGEFVFVFKENWFFYLGLFMYF